MFMKASPTEPLLPLEKSLEPDEARIERLKNALLTAAPGRRVSIAFSGGLDSRFLSFFALRLDFEIELLHVHGPHVSEQETLEARAWADSHGFKLKIVELNPLQAPEVSRNCRERCYFCKRMLFTELLRIASFPLCDGTNHSDLGNYRPGLLALRELKINSPLAMAQISKPEIRELGRALGFDNPDQVARPCILTRLPYDTAVSAEDLKNIAETEREIFEAFAESSNPQIAFRLRKVRGKAYELHVQAQEYERLSSEERSLLERLVKERQNNFGPVPIVPMDKLSGFFDRK